MCEINMEFVYTFKCPSNGDTPLRKAVYLRVKIYISTVHATLQIK